MHCSVYASAIAKHKVREVANQIIHDAKISYVSIMVFFVQYVQADRERGEVQSSSSRELESEKELLASTSLENGDILNQKLSTDSAMGSMSEQSLVSVSRTGDPAQDMLDLFLGPLLKKPVEDQNRTKFTANDIFDIEFRKLSETQKNDAGQEHTVAAPVMKKKSSLKDKVAVLLD